jgi:hypothetical protein
MTPDVLALEQRISRRADALPDTGLRDRVLQAVSLELERNLDAPARRASPFEFLTALAAILVLGCGLAMAMVSSNSIGSRSTEGSRRTPIALNQLPDLGPDVPAEEARQLSLLLRLAPDISVLPQPVHQMR